MFNFKNTFTIKGKIILILILILIILCGCSNNYNPIPSVGEEFIGEWTAINPTRISKINIYYSGNKIIVHEWEKNYGQFSEDYDWGERVAEISDLSDGKHELNWATSYDEWSFNQKIEILDNGVLKVFSILDYYDEDSNLTCTDYFYNPEDENSYAPSLPGVGLYQDDSEFINLVKTLNSPFKIVKYMEKNFNYKELDGPHSPYQTYLSKEGDCADHAVFACAIANYHGYESFFVGMGWTSGVGHAITVYDMGDYYIYSNVDVYIDQRFNSIEECVNHCATGYVGYIAGNLSAYDIYNWNYYYYRNISIR